MKKDLCEAQGIQYVCMIFVYLYQYLILQFDYKGKSYFRWVARDT